MKNLCLSGLYRYRAEPRDLVVSPGEVARGIGSALADARVCLLRDKCPAPGWPSLQHIKRDVHVLTPWKGRMNHTTPPEHRCYNANMTVIVLKRIGGDLVWLARPSSYKKGVTPF